MDFSTFYLRLHPRLVSTLAAVSGEVDLAADAAGSTASPSTTCADESGDVKQSCFATLRT